jgi:hypothetical protein
VFFLFVVAVTLNYELKGVVHGKVGEQIRLTIEVREEESKQPYRMSLPIQYQHFIRKKNQHKIFQ